MSAASFGSGDQREGDGAVRPQHHILTLFGLFGREGDATLTIHTLIRMLAALGIDSPAVRSSVSRLKRRGTLESVRYRGQAAYRLTADVAEIFRSGDERIFAPTRMSVGDAWILASFSVPESERTIRHQIRSLLGQHGFGQVSPGLWIAPGVMHEPLARQLDRTHLQNYVDLFDATPSGSHEDVRRQIATWWDLDALAAGYWAFLDEVRPIVTRWSGVSVRANDPELAQQAFVDDVRLVTSWRRLPYLDPGLPLELLPEGWPGVEATAAFLDVHEGVAPLARQWAADLIDGE